MNLEKLQPEDYATMLSLLKENFPRNEIRSDQKQLEVINEPYFQAYLLKENTEIYGFVSCFDFTDFVFIEHLVIAPSHQGAGLGSQLLTLLKQKYRSLILEVELPTSLQAKKRIQFYQKNQFFFNDIPYVIPSFIIGEQPIPLRMMSYPNQLTLEQFNYIKDILYRNVYI